MNENVVLIPAKKRPGNNVAKDAYKPKLKVAAYCRVSTDSDEQAGSYDAQVEHYTEHIAKNEAWEFAGIYADDGITGVTTKNREGFKEMIDDCMDGKIDIVLTKSISRFARNTLDCLKYVRQLREKNIAIIFEKENINTLDSTGELLLTIMASLAQQESESISQNVKMGIQYRYQNGQYNINYNRFLGYTKGPDGKLAIVEEEAKIVRRIYKEFLDGATLRDIANGLQRDKVMTGAKKYKWHMSTVEKILKNEKYMGDALMQKTITKDFMQKTRKKNDGTVPQYYVTNGHEAIIPRDIFTEVQEEFLRRNSIYTKTSKKRLYSSKYALSSLCTCTKCGDVYRRIVLTDRGKVTIKWKCCTRFEHRPNACPAPMVPDVELKEAAVTAINQVLKCSKDMKVKLKENIEAALANDNSKELEAINKVLTEKQKELLELARARKDYSKLAEEIEKLKADKKELMVSKAQNEGVKRKVAEMERFLQEAPTEVTEFDDIMVRRYIREIKIYDDRFHILFKAGIDIDVPRDGTK